MTELLTSRSRILTRQRCQRARYWLDEAFATGFSPVKVAIPLATGGAVHRGIRDLMEVCRRSVPIIGWPQDYTDAAVDLARAEFRDQCAGRSLDIEALESQSFVYNEQLALVEALVRLVGMRVMPRLLELYEVLEVERLDVAKLTDDYSEELRLARQPDDEQYEWQVLFRSIPDALVRSRSDGDLYVISWKTTSEYSASRDQDARTDMQGLSECWAAEARLADWANHWHLTSTSFDPGISPWFRAYMEEHVQAGGGMHDAPKIRGVQMIYLVKGPRPKDKEGKRVQTTPLIRGLRKFDPTGLLPPEFATERYYTCTEPHPFKYAKGGTCPGGVNHKRGDDWASVNMWETDGGVRGWLELLERGGVGAAGIAALDSAWVMPVPHFRTSTSVKSWERQTRAAESRHARDLLLIREYEEGLVEHPEDDKLWESWNARLDELFPQTTERCGDWFRRKCACWDLCHGAPHIAQDPVGSGLYQIKQQYRPELETVNE